MISSQSCPLLAWEKARLKPCRPRPSQSGTKLSRKGPAAATKTPGPDARNNLQYIEGIAMKFVVIILKRIGRKSDKPQAPDRFELRLKRIGAREARVAPHKVLFTPPLPLQEA